MPQTYKKLIFGAQKHSKCAPNSLKKGVWDTKTVFYVPIDGFLAFWGTKRHKICPKQPIFSGLGHRQDLTIKKPSSRKQSVPHRLQFFDQVHIEHDDVADLVIFRLARRELHACPVDDVGVGDAALGRGGADAAEVLPFG